MVNFGLNSASIIGILNIILGLAWMLSSIYIVIWKNKIIGVLGATLYGIQLFCFPPILMLSGLILLGQGWRLDPILQFAFLLQEVIIIYSFSKDIIIFDLLGKKRKQTK